MPLKMKDATKRSLARRLTEWAALLAMLSLCNLCSAAEAAACDGDGALGTQMTISGACAYSLSVNGAYTLQGTTADGREYYVNGNGRYLFYDANCGGDAGTSTARWKIADDKPSTTATTDLAGDGGTCAAYAYLNTAARTLPSSATWRMFCAADTIVDTVLSIAAPTCICKLGYSGDSCEVGSAPPACDGKGALGKQLVVSGACERQSSLNGVYALQGKIADGTEYFMNGEGDSLYYETDCTGTPAKWVFGDAARWVFDNTKATTNLANVERGCVSSGYLPSDYTIPPAEAKWRMACELDASFTPVNTATCKCNGKVNTDNQGGPDCSSFSAQRPFCYTDVGACSDGRISRSVENAEYSNDVCGGEEYTDVAITIDPPTCICKLGYSGDNCEFYSLEYKVLDDSKTCDDEATGAYIDTKAGCEAAASTTHLDLRDEGAYVRSGSNDHPYGCYYQPQSSFPDIADNVRLTLNVGAGAVKGTKRSGYQSICFVGSTTLTTTTATITTKTSTVTTVTSTTATASTQTSTVTTVTTTTATATTKTSTVTTVTPTTATTPTTTDTAVTATAAIIPTKKNTTANKTQATTPLRVPGDVCTGSWDCPDTQCKSGRCCIAAVDSACTSCDDAGFCNLLGDNGNDNYDDDVETESEEVVSLSPTPSSIGSILGGVLGGVLLLLVGIGTFVYCYQKKDNTADPNVAEVAARAAAGSTFANLQLAARAKGSAAKQNDYANAPAKHAVVTTSTVHNAAFTGVVLSGNGGGGTSTSADSHAHDRFVEPAPSATGKYQGKLRVPKGYQPDSDCRMELLKAGDSLLVPQLADIVEDITTRLEQDGVARDAADYNTRFAFYAYTYEAPFLKSREQLYSVLNAALRAREDGKFKAWMPFIYYLNKALGGLPNVPTTVYKGMWDAQKHIGMYDGTKRVHWSGYSSTTTDVAVAQKFAGPQGLVLKIAVLNAKNVQPYSWFGTAEAELMLSPNMEFQTSPATKKYPERGRRRLVKERTFIDLMEIPGEKIYS